MDVESQAKIQQLTKEKDELLDLAMQRGKIVQVCCNSFVALLMLMDAQSFCLYMCVDQRNDKQIH